MRPRPLPFRLLPALAAAALAASLVVGLAACGSSTPAASPSPSSSAAPDAAVRAVLLAKTQTAVQASLDGIDAALASAAAEIAQTGLGTPEAQVILDDLKASYPEVTDFATMDSEGTVVDSAPEGSSSASVVTAADLSRLEQTREPLLTGTVLVQGQPTVALVHPVLAPDGTVSGAVAASIETAPYLGGLIEPVVAGSGIDKVWVMDMQSTQLYDPDSSQVGLAVLTAPEYDPYPRIVELARTIAVQSSGSGQYDYKDPSTGQQVTKDAIWSSAGLYGTDWRLVLTVLVPPAG